MFLLLYLDIGQEFSEIAILKNEYIRIVLAGYHLFGADTIGCKETVVFFVLRICHGIIGRFRLILGSITIVDVALWHLSL